MLGSAGQFAHHEGVKRSVLRAVPCAANLLSTRALPHGALPHSGHLDTISRLFKAEVLRLQLTRNSGLHAGPVRAAAEAVRPLRVLFKQQRGALRKPRKFGAP